MTTKTARAEELDEPIERCAGIDVGQAELVVCARFPDDHSPFTSCVT